MKPGVNKVNGIYKVVLPVLAAALFYYISVVIKPFLYLHVQQTPFLQGSDFFTRYLDESGGITRYISQFVMQGFINNLVGTGIVLLILGILVFLAVLLIKTVFKKHIPIFPFLLLLFSLILLHNYFFPLIVLIQLVLVLSSLILFAKISLSSVNGWIKYACLYLFMYYVVGTGPALIFSLGSIVILLFSFPSKAFVKAAVLLVISIVVPYAAFQYIFNTTLSDAFFRFFPDLSFISKYNPSNGYFLYLFLIPILLLASGILKKFGTKISDYLKLKLQSNILVVVSILLLGVGSFFILKTSVDTTMRNVALCDYYNYTGSFDKTIEIALSTVDEYNISINVSYIRALANTGELTSRLFDYPQLAGSKVMEPDKIGTPKFIMAASDYYLDLGYVIESQHCAYGVLAINPDNLRAKKRLVVTNIIIGNFAAAKTYLYSIAKSFKTEDFVIEYMRFVNDPDQVNRDSYLSEKREFMVTEFAIPVQITDRILDLVIKNGSNQLALECLQTCHLLDHQLNRFMKNMDASLEFYDYIPSLYQQAILMYFFSVMKPGLENYEISSLSKNEFNEFLRILGSVGNKKNLAQEKLVSLSNTYLYYLTYLSPKVTNAKIIQQRY